MTKLNKGDWILMLTMCLCVILSAIAEIMDNRLLSGILLLPVLILLGLGILAFFSRDVIE